MGYVTKVKQLFCKHIYRPLKIRELLDYRNFSNKPKGKGKPNDWVTYWRCIHCDKVIVRWSSDKPKRK